MKLQALNEFLVVRSGGTFAVPNALYCMLHLEEVFDVPGRHLRRVPYLLGLGVSFIVRLGAAGILCVLLRHGLLGIVVLRPISFLFII